MSGYILFFHLAHVVALAPKNVPYSPLFLHLYISCWSQTHSNMCLFWEVFLESLKAEITTTHPLWISPLLLNLSLLMLLGAQSSHLFLFKFNHIPHPRQKKIQPVALNTIFILNSKFFIYSYDFTVYLISPCRWLLNISSLICQKWNSWFYCPSQIHYFLAISHLSL